jgi:putative membrane protein
MRDATTIDDVAKGALAGAAGGLVAAWAMNQFQRTAFGAGDGATDADRVTQDDPTTMQAADLAARRLAGRGLDGRRKRIAGPATHYATGAGLGLAYGVAAELLPAATAGRGAAFGALAALGLDEATLPALGLSGPPTEQPPSTHVYGLVSHIVFGLAAEAARAKLRRALG